MFFKRVDKNEFVTDGEMHSRTLYYYPPPLPSLGGGGGVIEESKIIGNKTNPMNIQYDLNIKYHIICSFFTDSMHLISIRKVADRKFQKKGK